MNAPAIYGKSQSDSEKITLLRKMLLEKFDPCTLLILMTSVIAPEATNTVLQQYAAAGTSKTAPMLLDKIRSFS